MNSKFLENAQTAQRKAIHTAGEISSLLHKDKKALGVDNCQHTRGRLKHAQSIALGISKAIVNALEKSYELTDLIHTLPVCEDTVLAKIDQYTEACEKVTIYMAGINS